jgi:cell division protein FtsL
MTRLALLLSKILAALAIALLLTGLILTALSVQLATWPYRKLTGDRRAHQIAAAQQLALAAARLVAVTRQQRGG